MKDTLTKNKTQKICVLAMLTALYVVLSAFLKINIVGNIHDNPELLEEEEE